MVFLERGYFCLFREGDFVIFPYGYAIISPLLMPGWQIDIQFHMMVGIPTIFFYFKLKFVMHLIKELQHSPHFHIIDNNQALLEVCTSAQQKNVVALDTEFVRVRTYYPKLGLIQLYDGEQVSLIDPTLITDFKPFIQLLGNKKVLKVLHACGEDLRVFLHCFQQLPTPMMDTQVMANFMKFPASVGLATLIQHYFQLEIDKETSRTDWLARPLSHQQLSYAAADVWYLLPLYFTMQQQLAQTPWQPAIQQDCATLLEKQLQPKSVDFAYLGISNAFQLDPEQLMRLKLLAKWREEEAVRRDLPLNFVVRAEHLYVVAKYNPKHTMELLALGLTEQEVRIHGKKLLQLLSQMKRINPAEYPAPIERVSEYPQYKSVLKTLQKTLRSIAPDNLNPEVIGSKRSLEQLLKWCWLEQRSPQHMPDLLLGWRKPFGEQLLQQIPS